jgi:hypothetical protein
MSTVKLGPAVAQRISVAIDRSDRSPETKSQFCGDRHHAGVPSAGQPVRLLISPSVVSAGKSVNVRLENRGKVRLSYGVAPAVDKLVSGEWRPQVFTQHGHPVGFPSIELSLPPRQLSACLDVPVSKSWEPGLYRVGFSVEKVAAGGAQVQHIEPMAFFRVRHQ